MKKALLLSVALMVIASTAFASVPSVLWFYDDFESYNDATRLRLAAPNWIGGTGPENYISSAYGSYDPLDTVPSDPGKGVRLRGSSGTGASSDAMTAVSFAEQATGNIQILHFMLQSDVQNQMSGFNHIEIWLWDEFGGEMGRWYGRSDSITSRYGGNLGTSVNIQDGAWYDFDLIYDPATGIANWYVNGGLSLSYNIGANRRAERVYIKDTARVDDFGVGINDWIYLDQVAVGTVPEPSSLLALSAFGVGMIGYIKRRRA